MLSAPSTSLPPPEFRTFNGAPSHPVFHRRRHLSPWVKFGLPFLAIFLLWVLYHTLPLVFTSIMLSWGLSYLLGPLVDFLEFHSIRRGAGGAIALLGFVSCLYLAWLGLETSDLRSKAAALQRNLIDRAQGVLNWTEGNAPQLKKLIELSITSGTEKMGAPEGSKNPVSPSTKKGSSPDALKVQAPPLPSLQGKIVDTLQTKLGGSALGLAFQGVVWAGNFLVVFILTLYFTFFFLKDGRTLKKRMIQWVPNRYFEMALKFFYEWDRRIRSYLLSMLIDCALIGLFVGFGSAIVGTPYPVVFGLIAFAFNTIPLMGPLLYGSICAIITLGLAPNPLPTIIGFGTVFLLSRFCDDLILVPTIYGKSHHIHPVVIVIAVLSGAHLAGAWGMFLAVPITSTLILAMTIAQEIAEGEDVPPLPAAASAPFA